MAIEYIFKQIKPILSALFVIKTIEMDFDQIKKLFDTEQYGETLSLLSEHENRVTSEEKCHFHEIRGACFFMMNHNLEANDEYMKAILQKPIVCDYFISRAAVLRCMGQTAEAKKILEEQFIKVSDPAILFNLLEIAMKENDREKVLELRERLSNEDFKNQLYRTYKGIVPYFLKQKEVQIETVIAQEQEIIETITTADPQNIDYEDLRVKVLLRINHCNLRGVLYQDRNLQRVINGLQRLFEDSKVIYHEIEMHLERRKAEEMIGWIMKEIQQNWESITAETITNLLLDVENYINEVRKKEVHVSMNYQAFSEKKRLLKAEHIISDNSWSLLDSMNPEIQIFKTIDNEYIFVDKNRFLNKIKPSALNACLENNCSQRQSKYFYDLHWLILLKVLFTSEAGYELESMVKMKDAIICLYEELKPSNFECEGLNNFVFIYQKCEKFNQFYKQPHLPKNKVEQINENCFHLKSYIEQLDSIFAKFLEKESNREFLLNLEKICPEHLTFRNDHSLNKNFESILFENLVTIVYHFRNRVKHFDILNSAFEEMVTESEQEFNGKTSFLKNYHRFQPQFGFFRRMWNSFLYDFCEQY